MLVTRRSLYTTLNCIRHLCLAATSVAMLFCCVALLPAQSVAELQPAVMGDVPTLLTLH
jgi:hypothetical protein